MELILQMRESGRLTYISSTLKIWFSPLVEWRNSSRKKSMGESGNLTQLWMCLVVKVKSCYKEQYCIYTLNVRSLNQGKLDMVKQEMARVNIDILGIGELKWMRMGKFNSEDHYIYYYGQESLRRNRVALIVNQRV